MGGRVVGIDLGTVNSCVAAVRDGRPEVLRDDGRSTVASCLAFQRGKEVVGEAARRQAVTDPHNTVSASKRLLGHAYDSAEVQTARERVSYSIRPSPLGSVILEVGGRELTPVQVAARVLQRVKEVAEHALGEPVERAVISVPAHFNDVQRKATKSAAEYAGLEVVRLINEPTAAAFAYGYRKAEDFTLAVYDLGGGTFDITVMTIRGDRFEVDATDGDSYLGGEDFDHAIVEWLVAEFREEFGHELQGDDEARLRLKEAAERAKIELSELTQTRIELPFLTQLPDGSRPHFARALTREKLEELARPVMEQTLELCRRCLQAAGLQPGDVQEVLLVGGQTRMPLVRAGVRELFGREPRRDINPDEVVSMGAALYGYSLEADDLQAQAEEAASEAFALARKETALARKLLSGVEEIGDGAPGDPQLSSRLKELLDAAEAELPSFQTPERSRDEDLPVAVDQLRDEMLEIERKAAEVVAKVQAELPSRQDASLDRAAANLTRFLESAQDASDEAIGHFEEAQEHAKARKVELVDVTSHALGIAAAEDLFSVLIAKNTQVPAEHRRIFTTAQDGQTEVEIQVLQGAAKRAAENQMLGNFILEGIEPAPRMTPKIEVSFRIDESGILAVRAQDSLSGAEQGLRVEDPLQLQQVRAEGAPEETAPEGAELAPAPVAEDFGPESGAREIAFGDD